MTREVGMMKMETFQTIVDESAGWRPELRLFNFGEPLLHPGLGEMIKYARKKGLNPNFQTNGLLLDEAKIVTILEAGITYVGISVNGLTEAEYAMIRPGCRMRDIKSNLQLLRTISHRLKKPVHIHLNAQILADEKNSRQSDIQSYVLYWDGIPDSLSITGISLFSGVTIMAQGRSEIVNHAHLPVKTASTVVCTEPFDRLIIKWDGRVTACCSDYDAQLVLGQIGFQTIAEIWNGFPLTDLRDTVAKQRYSSSPLCRSCPKLYSKEFTILFKKPSPGRSPG